MIEKATPNTCGFVMDFIRFSLEQGRDKNGLCNKDYLHLPDGDRLCGDITGRSKLTLFTYFFLSKTVNVKSFTFRNELRFSH